MCKGFFLKLIFSFIYLILLPIFVLAQQYTVVEVYPGITPIVTSEDYTSTHSFYFPDIYCSNGSTTSCSSPYNLNLIGVGSKGCTTFPQTDKIFKYVCKSQSNPQSSCDLSNPYDWSWEKVFSTSFNPCKDNYCSEYPDHYAEPCYLKANNKHFIFYTHPNGDSQSRGKIQFAYSIDGQNWYYDYNLLKIANENIRDCSCRGGPTRPAAIYKDKDGYFYIYFEVWRNKKIFPKESCCPGYEEGNEVARQEQFLIRVLPSNQAPYIRLEDGRAEIYKKSTGEWIPMDYDEGVISFPYEDIDIHQLDTGYIFGWHIDSDYDINCPSLHGYTYPNGKVIKFNEDSLFPLEANDSLGDVNLKFDGSDGCVAIFSTFESTNSQWDREILTRESSNCINFNEPYVLQNWELTGLTKDQLSHTGPSVLYWNSDTMYRRYLMAYSKVPKDGNVVYWNLAQVQLGVIKRNINTLPPKPGPIKLIRLRLKDSISYYDWNNDGVLDTPIILPIDSYYESIINSIQPLAYEEYGNYRVKAYYSYCYYKNKKKIKCVIDDDQDIPGIGFQEDQNVLYFKKGYFESGDELQIQLILRAYDEEKPKDKQKKCKKDDTCIDVLIKFEQ